MSQVDRAFDYVAIDALGRRTRGHVQAASENGAFSALKRDGLAPIKLTPRRARQLTPSAKGRLRDQQLESLLIDLAALLRAGADIRSSLAILGRRSVKSDLRQVCETLSASIGAGEGVEAAFATQLGRRCEVIPALIAAGEASGDLASGLERGGEVLAARRAIRDQLISTLSYPAFILISTCAAMGLILFAVVPSLAPLVQDAGPKSAPLLAGLVSVSHLLSENALAISVGLASLVAVLTALGRMGLLSRPLQRLALDGPLRRLVTSLIFGGFARSLGVMLAAGAPMSDALRLAIRTASWSEVRARLTPVLDAVRQGETLSLALDQMHGFPVAIARLAAVGEATGALGPMLRRSGAFEEGAALKRIEAISKLLGPALIMVLGLMIGLLMASLLSGVTGLGDAALKE